MDCRAYGDDRAHCTGTTTTSTTNNANYQAGYDAGYALGQAFAQMGDYKCTINAEIDPETKVVQKVLTKQSDFKKCAKNWGVELNSDSR